MKEDIKELILKEFKKAENTYPRFASAHEGYAILLEEVEEMNHESEILNEQLHMLWQDIKGNKVSNQLEYLHALNKRSLLLIEEAIQVTAMIVRFEDNIFDEEKDITVRIVSGDGWYFHFTGTTYDIIKQGNYYKIINGIDEGKLLDIKNCKIIRQ